MLFAGAKMKTPNQALPIPPFDEAQDFEQAHDPKPFGPELIEGQPTADRRYGLIFR